jgi:hypothetical protein
MLIQINVCIFLLTKIGSQTDMNDR